MKIIKIEEVFERFKNHLILQAFGKQVGAGSTILTIVVRLICQIYARHGYTECYSEGTNMTDTDAEKMATDRAINILTLDGRVSIEYAQGMIDAELLKTTGWDILNPETLASLGLISEDYNLSIKRHKRKEGVVDRKKEKSGEGKKDDRKGEEGRKVCKEGEEGREEGREEARTSAEPTTKSNIHFHLETNLFGTNSSMEQLIRESTAFRSWADACYTRDVFNVLAGATPSLMAAMRTILSYAEIKDEPQQISIPIISDLLRRIRRKEQVIERSPVDQNVDALRDVISNELESVLVEPRLRVVMRDYVTYQHGFITKLYLLLNAKAGELLGINDNEHNNNEFKGRFKLSETELGALAESVSNLHYSEEIYRHILGAYIRTLRTYHHAAPLSADEIKPMNEAQKISSNSLNQKVRYTIDVLARLVAEVEEVSVKYIQEKGIFYDVSKIRDEQLSKQEGLVKERERTIAELRGSVHKLEEAQKVDIRETGILADDGEIERLRIENEALKRGASGIWRFGTKKYRGEAYFTQDEVTQLISDAARQLEELRKKEAGLKEQLAAANASVSRLESELEAVRSVHSAQSQQPQFTQQLISPQQTLEGYLSHEEHTRLTDAVVGSYLEKVEQLTKDLKTSVSARDTLQRGVTANATERDNLSLKVRELQVTNIALVKRIEEYESPDAERKRAAVSSTGGVAHDDSKGRMSQRTGASSLTSVEGEGRDGSAMQPGATVHHIYTQAQYDDAIERAKKEASSAAAIQYEGRIAGLEQRALSLIQIVNEERTAREQVTLAKLTLEADNRFLLGRKIEYEQALSAYKSREAELVIKEAKIAGRESAFAEKKGMYDNIIKEYAQERTKLNSDKEQLAKEKQDLEGRLGAIRKSEEDLTKLRGEYEKNVAALTQKEKDYATAVKKLDEGRVALANDKEAYDATVARHKLVYDNQCADIEGRNRKVEKKRAQVETLERDVEARVDYLESITPDRRRIAIRTQIPSGITSVFGGTGEMANKVYLAISNGEDVEQLPLEALPSITYKDTLRVKRKNSADVHKVHVFSVLDRMYKLNSDGKPTGEAFFAEVLYLMPEQDKTK